MACLCGLYSDTLRWLTVYMVLAHWYGTIISVLYYLHSRLYISSLGTVYMDSFLLQCIFMYGFVFASTYIWFRIFLQHIYMVSILLQDIYGFEFYSSIYVRFRFCSNIYMVSIFAPAYLYGFNFCSYIYSLDTVFASLYIYKHIYGFNDSLDTVYASLYISICMVSMVVLTLCSPLCIYVRLSYCNFVWHRSYINSS